MKVVTKDNATILEIAQTNHITHSLFIRMGLTSSQERQEFLTFLVVNNESIHYEEHHSSDGSMKDFWGGRFVIAKFTDTEVERLSVAFKGYKNIKSV